MNTNQLQANSLFEDILAALSEGRGPLLIWGVNPVTLRLVGLLTEHGLADNLAAVIDPRDPAPKLALPFLRVCSPRELSAIDFGTLVLSADEGKETALQEFANADSRTPHVIMAGDNQYEFANPVFTEIVRSSPVKSKAGGYPNMLVHLFQSLQYIASQRLDGHVAEFGVFQGGTTVIMAKILAHYGHPGRVYGFDTFGGFPAPRSVLDTYRDAKCEFPDYATVRAYCAPYNIELIAGDIHETLARLEDLPLALSFFDTDNYSATRAALPICVRHTVPGGIIAFDHYYSPGWPRTIGEKVAADEVLAASDFFHLHGTGIFAKRV